MVDSADKEIAGVVKGCPLIIGVGPSAWPRIITSFYFPKFKIICYTNCQDNQFIRDSGVEIFSLRQEDPSLEIAPVTPGKILNTQGAKKFLASQKQPFVLLVYKSVGSLEKVCRDNSWKFIGNSKEIREKFEDKKIFKEILRKIGTTVIPGENIPIGMLNIDKLVKYQKMFGQKNLVLQIAEATWGGGSGTLFVNDAKDLSKFFQRVEELKKSLEGKKKKIKSVNIAPFIEGTSASIACCATKYGTLTGPVQTQIVDLDEVGAKLQNRSGVFAGHDWSYIHFSEDVQKQASEIARQFGEYLYKNGFKGIFGLDLIVDKAGKVWPVECNPRETDAFPLICMLQMDNGAVPMQVFHNLEHLGVEYHFDFKEVDESYKRDYEAAQILLYNKLSQNVVDRGVLTAGVYKLERGKLKYLRPGFLFSDLKKEGEFLFTEDIPQNSGNAYISHERIIRMITKGGVLAKNGKVKPEVKKAIDLVYDQLKLIPVENGLDNEKGLKTLYVNRMVDAVSHAKLVQADVVNLVRDYASGFRRPLNIAWRKKLDDSPIVGQIPSKRARKHISSDLKKLKSLGIKIESYPRITKQQFSEWLTLYRKVIGAKKRGSVLVDENWLANKRKTGKTVGAVLAFKKGKIIGGDVFFELKKQKVLCVGYGVAENIPQLAGSLTLLIDYHFLCYAQGKGYKEVSFGQDSNLYGLGLSSGLIFYKAKLGFSPKPAAKSYFTTTYFLNNEKSEGDIMFFSGSGNGNLKLTVLKERTEEKPVLLPPGVETSEIFSVGEIVMAHRKLLYGN